MRPFAAAHPIRSPVKPPGPSPTMTPPICASDSCASPSTSWTRGTIWAACWRAPRIDRANVCSRTRTATLAMSVAVSMASHGSFLKHATPRIRVVGQPKMPIEGRSPRPRALRPLDQHDGAFANHVVEAEIACFVRITEAVAIDMVDRCRTGMVMMDERVRRARGTRCGSQAAADRLHECRLPRPQLSRQPDYRGCAELAAEVLTEPAELARGEAHRP